jgi:PTS system ascorbate-specific IIA component
VQRLLGRLPLQIETFEVPFDVDLDELLPAASAALRRADSGAGVLILTDLFGASPSNLALRLTQLGTPTRRVAGLSLPMLLRVCNYQDQALDELALIAVGGGKTGVVLDHG